MQITIELDNDTIAALAVGAMKDSVSLDTYISTAVTELAQVIHDQSTEEAVTGDGNGAPATSDPTPDEPTFTPTAEQHTEAPVEKPGGPGAPLYAEKSTGWKL